MDTVTLLYSPQLIVHKSGAVAADSWQTRMSVMSVYTLPTVVVARFMLGLLQAERLQSEFRRSASLLWFAKNPVAIRGAATSRSPSIVWVILNGKMAGRGQEGSR
jgi:hypothetical protein